MSTAGSTAGRRDPLRGATLQTAPLPYPMLVPALALAGGIWLADIAGPLTHSFQVVAGALPLAAFALLVLAVWRKTMRRPLLVSLVAVSALAVGFTRYQVAVDRPASHVTYVLTDEPVLTRLAGRIVTSPLERPGLKRNPFLVFDPPPRTQFVLALDELRATDPPTPASGNVQVNVEATGLTLRLGQRVQLTGRLYRPRGPRNPGETDWALWHRRQGIDAGLNVESAGLVQVLPDPPSLLHRTINALRGTVRNLLFEPFAAADTDECVALLDTMVLGQRSAADQKLNEAFLRAGGAHFLAVSGFNVSLLAGAAWWFVRRVLRRGACGAALGALVVAVLFALVTEPNAPILRAAVAAILAGIATLLRRPFCGLNWLAAAAVFVLLFNPQELFRAGFQLSFFLVLALITVVPHSYYFLLGRRRADVLPPPDAQTVWQVVQLKAGRFLVGLTVTCVCAWVISLPLVLLHFGRFAPWGWLGTMLLTPHVTFVTLLSFAVLLANAVLPPVGALLGQVLHWSADGLLWSVGLFEHLPGALIECRPPPTWLVTGTYGLAAVLALWRAAQRRSAGNAAPGSRNTGLFPRTLLVKVTASGAIVLCWIGWLVLPAGAPAGCRCHTGPGYDLHVLAVGDGNTVLLTTPTGRALVFDVGTDTNSDAGEVAARALNALGVRRIDAVLISHANVDHYSGLPTLLSRMPVARWFVTPYFTAQDAPESAVGRLLAQLPHRAPAPTVVRAGERLAFGDASLEVLWPPAGLDPGWPVNDRSLVARLSAGGRTVLLTGDIERDALRALLDVERGGRISLRADVLLAPHHGAVLKGLTADFYAAVSPSVVLVSNRTPRPKLGRLVFDTLGPACRLVTTGDCGAITVHLGSAGPPRVETPYAGGGVP